LRILLWISADGAAPDAAVAARDRAALAVSAVSVAAICGRRGVALITVRVARGVAGAEALTITVERAVLAVVSLVRPLECLLVLVGERPVLAPVLLALLDPFAEAVVVRDPPRVVVGLPIRR
jgi:hypothetical protein